jgi:hypothetical protein
MRNYGKISTKIWNDIRFNSLSRDGKLIFFFLQTHPAMTSLGAMRGSQPGLAAEMNFKKGEFSKALNELINHGMVEYDEKSNFIGLPNFLKHNVPESPNVIRSWAKAIEWIPECKLKIKLIRRAVDFVEGLPKGFKEALPKVFEKTYLNQEQEQEQEQDIKSLPPSSSEIFTAELEEKNIFIFIPLQSHEEFPIQKSKVEEWGKLYPAVDVEQELRKMKGWCDANVDRRKTKKGILRFVTNWLAKQQDSGKNNRESYKNGSSTGIIRDFTRPRSKVDIFEESTRSAFKTAENA